jgi:hypothetical protein
VSLVLPFSSVNPITKFSTTIDGVQYGFRARWNSRDNYDPATRTSAGSWYFDVADASGDPIMSGVKIVLGAFLGRQVKHPLFRDGVIAAVDLSGKGREATIADLGDRVRVVRFTTAEVLSLRITSDFPDPTFARTSV